MTPEAAVKEKIKAIAAKHGVLVRSNVMMGYGNHSQADMTLCVGGRYLAVEAKATAKSRITWLQLIELVAVITHGGAAMVVHAGNLIEFEQLLEQLCLQPTAESPLARAQRKQIESLVATMQPPTSPGKVQPRRR